ncbi:MAG: hypothetical protein HYW91_00180 [Candidatus Sungbacteria bacterium]|nr:hypothetical protein [Candidatus Sungbacteria bacterium]
MNLPDAGSIPAISIIIIITKLKHFMSKEGAKQGYVEMDEGAWEAAHAEKPFRDAISDYKESLSEEAKKALEWIASQEAEKAIAQFEKDKKDSPTLRTLRERTLATLNVPADVKSSFGKFDKEAINPTFLKNWQWALEEMGKLLVEKTLSGGGQASNKAALLELMGTELGEGIRRYASDGKENRLRGMSGNIARGELIAAVMAGDETRMGRMINEIAFQSSVSKREVIKEILSFLQKVRTEHQDVALHLDAALGKEGWLWDKKNKTYFEME